MLYFVAPEWWMPRRHQTRHTFDPAAKVGDIVTSLTDEDQVKWGDVPKRLDNYSITEKSNPAKLGSSLGWLIQLDGDNVRNAFLNAPWVKAVIPIRPGKEEAAISWLKGVEGFNGIGEGDLYEASNPDEKDINGKPLDGQPMLDVILDLAKKISAKHR